MCHMLDNPVSDWLHDQREHTDTLMKKKKQNGDISHTSRLSMVTLSQFTVNLLCVPGGQGCVSFPEQLRQLSAWPEGCGHGSQEHRGGQQEAAD